jgi:non-ribosomal peptide synthetase component F
MHDEVRAVLAGQAETLPPPTPFRNLIAEVQQGVPAAEHERFFRERLGDIDEPTAPFGVLDVHRDGKAIGEVRTLLPQSLNQRLRAQARRLGVSLASLCHLAWAQVLSRATGVKAWCSARCCSGACRRVPITGVGLFINTLPLRIDLDAVDVEDAARRTHTALAELLRHEHASLAWLSGAAALMHRRLCSPPCSTSRHHQPRVTTTTMPVTPATVQRLSSEQRTNYPLTLSVDDFGEQLGLTAQVVETLSAERICAYMQQALESLSQALEHAPKSAVGMLEVLPEQERSLLLEQWNRTESPWPQQLCAHQLFEQQVAPCG